MKQQEKNNRKKSAVLLALLLFFIVFVGGYTYSRYMDTGIVRSTADIAKWSVQIGEKDLKEWTTAEPLAASLTLAPNAYVASNVIAPGRTGTYTVEIDPTGSQVAIDYIVNVDDITGLAVENSNFVVTGAKYWIGDVTGAGTAVEDIETNGVIVKESLADVQANKKVTIEVTIEWVNDEANNESDTLNGADPKTVTVKTSITAKQHLASDD